MKKLSTFALATAMTGLLLSAPLASQDITVMPDRTTTEQFVAEVSHDLDRALGQVRIPSWQLRGGITQVRFQVDDEGKSENVTLYRRSGDPVADRVALKAVKRLNSMGPLPRGLTEDQVIQANIIMATGEPQMERLQKRLAREEAARIAEAGQSQSPPVLALTLSANRDS